MVAAGIHIEKERTNDFRPALARARFDHGAAIMAAAPIIEDDGRSYGRGITVREKLGLGWSAAEEFHRRVDEPEADAILRAGPAESAVLELVCGVDIFVALAQRGRKVLVAFGVHRHPVERV